MALSPKSSPGTRIPSAMQASSKLFKMGRNEAISYLRKIADDLKHSWFISGNNVVLLYNGLKVIFLVKNNLCNVIVTTVHNYILLAESLRALS